MARAASRAAELGALLALLLGASSAVAQAGGAETTSESTAPTPTAPSDREAARLAFERGLVLVRESRYAEARAAFLEAYQAYPHHLVLYNVAQADVQLGNLESAITYLERFLREGADLLSAERTRQVGEQLQELRQRLTAAPPPSENDTRDSATRVDEPHEESSQPPAPQQARVLQLRSPESPAAASPSLTRAARQPVTHVSAPFIEPTAAPVTPGPALDAGRPWGIVLGATGVLLLGVASGLYVWNDSRHDDWKQERHELDALPNRDQALASNLELWQQAKANNELLESIERVDILTLVAAGVGALTLGAGAWDALAHRRPTPTFVAQGTGVSWRSSW